MVPIGVLIVGSLSHWFSIKNDTMKQMFHTRDFVVGVPKKIDKIIGVVYQVNGRHVFEFFRVCK